MSGQIMFTWLLSLQSMQSWLWLMFMKYRNHGPPRHDWRPEVFLWWGWRCQANCSPWQQNCDTMYEDGETGTKAVTIEHKTSSSCLRLILYIELNILKNSDAQRLCFQQGPKSKSASHLVIWTEIMVCLSIIAASSLCLETIENIMEHLCECWVFGSNVSISSCAHHTSPSYWTFNTSPTPSVILNKMETLRQSMDMAGIRLC